MHVEIADRYGVCADTEAILDDRTGLNFFEVQCRTNNATGSSEHGAIVSSNGTNATFVQGDPTYPKCLLQCKDFTVGNAQFIPLDTTLDVRAGETHRSGFGTGYHCLVATAPRT